MLVKTNTHRKKKRQQEEVKSKEGGHQKETSWLISSYPFSKHIHQKSSAFASAKLRNEQPSRSLILL